MPFCRPNFCRFSTILSLSPHFAVITRFSPLSPPLYRPFLISALGGPLPPPPRHATGERLCLCFVAGGWTGLFSVIMRDLANLTSDGPKWIVLDGDIDPMWIESLNTVMDDNKVLTLASNERIPLTPMMRLLFEISHLKTATPATVSRAGILYINPADLGWNPLVALIDNLYKPYRPSHYSSS